jgi:hypothetical protein
MFEHIIAYYEWQCLICPWGNTKRYGEMCAALYAYRRMREVTK